MRRVLLAMTAVAAILFAGGLSVTNASHSLHCPSGWGEKIENPGDSVVLAAGTVACVKGGQADPTSFVADGVTTLGEYLPGKWAVSYVAIYQSPTPGPSTSPMPSPSTDPSATPTTEPSPSPSVTPSPVTSPSAPPPASPSQPATSSTPTPTMPPTDTAPEGDHE